MKIPSLLCVAFGCLALSCSQSVRQQPAPQSAGDARVVAAIDGHSITVSDLQAEVDRRNHGRTLATIDSEERETILRDMVQNQTVYSRAVTEGFDQTPEVKRQIQELIVSRYLALKLEKDSQPEISEVEIQRHYDEHKDQFAIPEQVRFSVIKIGISPKATQAKQAEAYERVEAILGEARAGSGDPATFEALARRHSEDQATRYQGGDVGWISAGRPDRWDAPVVAAAFALQNPGDLSPVVATSNALFLVKLTERKPASRRPLAEVKTAIAYQLGVIARQQAETEFFESVKAGQKIEINRALLESLPVSTQQTESKPPGVPGG